MSVIEKSLQRLRSLRAVDVVIGRTVREVLQVEESLANPLSGTLNYEDKRGYELFRGWLYAAVNALASEGASQPVRVGRVTGEAREEAKADAITRTKVLNRFGVKSRNRDLEVLVDHPAIELLASPNRLQDRWRFVYAFIANLNLTGTSPIVLAERDGSLELYCLPSTWVEPIHRERPFSGFLVGAPSVPAQNKIALPPESVVYVQLPDPANPLAGLSPAETQMRAIRVDEHIQSSQEQFFRNGIFPSVIVTIGTNPHPDVQPGIRPRLTAEQRKQVIQAIKKVMSGVANYGNPAIVDGLIEKIERLSATQHEIGWEKSEKIVRNRILSAFGVHPFILGEPMNVGGYAQAYVIQEQFCRRVNTFLDLLSSVVTQICRRVYSDQSLLVWWERCEPSDPSLQWQNIREARKNGDISRNEFRAMLGLPPDETGGDRLRQWSTGDVTALLNALSQMNQGNIAPEQLQAVLEVVFDLDPEEARKLVVGSMGEDLGGGSDSDTKILHRLASVQVDGLGDRLVKDATGF